MVVLVRWDPPADSERWDRTNAPNRQADVEPYKESTAMPFSKMRQPKKLEE